MLARRTELRALRGLLNGGHRIELRSCLALSRLAATADAGATLAALSREARTYLDSADRPARDRLPALLARAIDEAALDLHTGWVAAVGPPLRRLATERSLAMPPGWPRLPGPGVAPCPAEPPEPGGGVRTLLAGAADGAALWRLAGLPLAVSPLLGLPVLGGPALAPLAVGIGVVAVGVAVRSRRTAAERVRLRRHVDEVLTAARTALDVELGRSLLELERASGAALDAAAARRRAEIDAELARLAGPAPAGVAGA